MTLGWYIVVVAVAVIAWWAFSGLLVWFWDYRDKPFNWRILWDIRTYEEWMQEREESE